LLKIGLVALCVVLIACNCVSNAQTDGVNVFDNSVAIDGYIFTTDIPIVHNDERGVPAWYVQEQLSMLRTDAVPTNGILNVIEDPRISQEDNKWKGIYGNWVDYVNNSATNDSIAHAMIDIAIVDIPIAWENLNLTQNELLTSVIGRYPTKQANITFCGYPAHLIETNSRSISNAKISVLLNNDTICVITASMSFNSENYTNHAVDLIHGITITQADNQMLSMLPAKAADSMLQTAISTLVELMPAMKPAAPCDECISTLVSIDNIQGNVVQTWYGVCWNGSAFQKLSWRGGQAKQYTPITLEEIPYDAYIYLIDEAKVWVNPRTITKEEFIDIITRVNGETYYASNDTLVTRVITASDTGRIGHIEDNTPEIKKYAEEIHYYGPLPTCVREYVA
jgi:hypothetical protein